MAPPIPENWRDALARRFGIDARALATLRIALGLLVVCDLLLRARDLRAHYTDAGVLPRELLSETFPAFARVSIHALSGTVWFQALLFVLAGFFALALLVGYRTRLTTIATFVLLVSLHARNPVVLNAGDSLLRRLLLWGAFLPLGGRWSIDALRSERSNDRVANLATAALLLQVTLVYLVNGLLKLRGDAWLGGEAVRIVFDLDHLTVFLGDYLAGSPILLGALDRVWLAMTLTSFLLVVLLGRSRAAFASLFVGAHLGMALTMRLGLFPFVSIAGLLVFLPPPVWDRVERSVVEGGRVRAWVGRADGLLSDCSSPLPSVVPGSSTWTRRTRTGVVAILLGIVLVWNAAALGYVDLPDGIEAAVDPGERRWDMFAPDPRSVDGWYVTVGVLESGERVDAFRGGSVEWDRPPDLASTYPTHRWFVYLLDLQRPGGAPLRPRFAEYLCRRWDRTHAIDLAKVTVYYVEEPTRLGRPDPTRRRNLGEFACSGPRSLRAPP